MSSLHVVLRVGPVHADQCFLTLYQEQHIGSEHAATAIDSLGPCGIQNPVKWSQRIQAVYYLRCLSLTHLTL